MKDTPSVWTLSIKPRICIMPQNQQLCEMESDIFWSGQTKADICLLSSMQSDNVQCWSNALQGHLIEKIVINKQISYWLSPTGSNKVLVKSQILIVTIPDKNTKRRRRHIWSLL